MFPFLTASARTKLSLSHALAQSVKISLVSNALHLTHFLNQFSQFESRIATAIEQTKDVPDMIASTGTIPVCLASDPRTGFT